MLLLLQTVGKVSFAAKGLCLWVRAMETYGTVAKDVAPKRNKLKTAQDNLSKKQTALAAAQTQLAEVLAKVQALKVTSTPFVIVSSNLYFSVDSTTWVSMHNRLC